jgi:glyoxylate reductase
VKPPVLVTHRLPSTVMRRLQDTCEVDLYAGPDAIPPEELTRRIAGKRALVAMLTDRVAADLMDAAPELRIIANVAVGYENVDVAAATSRGIVVTNTPDVLTGAVAEFTWGLILALARRIVEGDRFVRRGGWKGWALDFMLGAELTGKQLGIVGAGRIGRAVAEKAGAFGMKPVFAKHDMSFDELLVSSDVVTVHVPLTADTRHLFDRRAFMRMKRSALFVNTARGAVVDEESLVWALKERLIAGAALDVFEREPHVSDALRAMENVVIAPHLGSATRETRTAMADLAVRNVLAVLAGSPALTPVTGQ